jgi:hypothetical protein
MAGHLNTHAVAARPFRRFYRDRFLASDESSGTFSEGSGHRRLENIDTDDDDQEFFHPVETASQYRQNAPFDAQRHLAHAVVRAVDELQKMGLGSRLIGNDLLKNLVASQEVLFPDKPLTGAEYKPRRSPGTPEDPIESFSSDSSSSPPPPPPPPRHERSVSKSLKERRRLARMRREKKQHESETVSSSSSDEDPPKQPTRKKPFKE